MNTPIKHLEFVPASEVLKRSAFTKTAQTVRKHNQSVKDVLRTYFNNATKENKNIAGVYNSRVGKVKHSEHIPGEVPNDLPGTKNILPGTNGYGVGQLNSSRGLQFGYTTNNTIKNNKGIK